MIGGRRRSAYGMARYSALDGEGTFAAAMAKKRKRQRIDTRIDFHLYESRKARALAAMVQETH